MDDWELALYLGTVLLVLFVVYRMVIFVLVFLINPLGELESGDTSYIFPFVGNYYRSATGRLFQAEYALHEVCGSAVRISEDLASVIDPQVVHQILEDEDWPKSKNSYAHLAFNKDTDNILTTTDKIFHARIRSLVAPAFSSEALSVLEPLMIKVWNTFEDKIRTIQADGDGWIPVNMDTYSANIALDIIGETIFGSSFRMIESGNHPLLDARRQVFDSVLHKVFWPYLGYFYSGPSRTKAVETELRLLTNAVDARVGLNKSGERRVDILQTLLDYKDPVTGDKLSEEEVARTIGALHMAGGETTGGALSWAIYYLLRTPTAFEKLRIELDEAFPTGLSERLELAKLKKLPFLDAVIKETLRLRPAVSSIVRKLEHEKTLYFRDVKGKLTRLIFPEETHVAASLFSLHRSARLWVRPNDFDPERWNDGLAAPGEHSSTPVVESQSQEQCVWGKPLLVNRGAYLPFSKGSRDCVGKEFALDILRFTLGHLIRRFEILPHPIDPQLPQRTDAEFGIAFVASRIGEKDALLVKMRFRVA
ncbi:hypothetical protein HDU93_010094 [Gonapodya sp. JEL0774]|nr:hypothetical protein HDU93_010094 [Gonapodya sp. JEL0774]